MIPMIRTCAPVLGLSLTAALAVGLLTACGGGSDTPAGPQTVTLDFTAVAGGVPVRCGQPIAALGTAAATAQLHDLRWYVSNVELIAADGSRVPLTLGANDDWNLTQGSDRVSLIDLEDASGACGEEGTGTAAMNSQITGTVPPGHYTGVAFTLGVPFALNHSNTATATKPLDLQALSWSWQMGRLFTKIEVTDAGTGAAWASPTFYTHVGSTGCTGNPANGETVACAKPNRAAITLTAFNPATQRIALDLQALFAGSDVTVNAGGAPGCMSGGTDPECGPVFAALALDWQPDGSGSGQPVNGGAAQTVFKAVAK